MANALRGIVAKTEGKFPIQSELSGRLPSGDWAYILPRSEPGKQQAMFTARAIDRLSL